MAKSLSQRLLQPFAPAYRAARAYDLATLRHDVLAGLTVAVVAIPQSMAYAVVAGVPAQYGLYTLIVQCFIGSLLNSQPLLSVGPINTQSLLVASIVTRLAQPGDTAMYLQLVIGLTLIKGLMQTVMSFARLGGAAKYVSHSAIVGFTAGAGVLIAVGQLHWLLGFAVTRSPSDWPGIVGEVQRLIPQLEQGHVQPLSIGVGLLCLAIVIGVGRASRLAPGPLLAVGVGAVMVWAFGWTSAQHLPLSGQLPGASQFISIFQVPRLTWQQVEALLGGAMALSLLGLMEAYSIGKTIAARTGQGINANRELWSQGVTNAISSFFQCIPGSGSFSRSALNYYAGARTCYAGVFNAAFVAAIILLLSSTARYIPMASLAAVLFVIAYGLIDWRYVHRVIKSSRADTAVCLGTFAATLVVPLVYAVFIGVFLNIALYLRRASQLHIAQMVRTAAGLYEEKSIGGPHAAQKVMFLQVEGDLFFGVADQLQEQLSRISADGAQIVILRLKRTHGIDATILNVLDQFTRDLAGGGGQLILCGVRPKLMRDLGAFGLRDTIGLENIFETDQGVFTSAKRALQRAQTLLGEPIDIKGIDGSEEEEDTREAEGTEARRHEGTKEE